MKHDWVAHTAPRGVFGFEIDRRFAYAPSNPLLSAAIKVSLFDVLDGTVSVTQAHHTYLGADDEPPRSLGSQPTLGDGQLKTYTFVAAPLDRRRDASHHSSHGHAAYPHVSNPFAAQRLTPRPMPPCSSARPGSSADRAAVLVSAAATRWTAHAAARALCAAGSTLRCAPSTRAARRSR